MKYRKSFVAVLFVAVAFACLQTAALGQGASQSANVRAEGMGVRFDSTIQHTSATLTISGPDGNVYRREFKAGAAPSFALLDKSGAPLGNGQYTYELRFNTEQARDPKERLVVAPDDGVEDEQGRTSRKRLSVQTVVQSGSFSVLNGVLYVGNEIEPTSRRTSSTKNFATSPLLQRSTGVMSGNTINRLRNHRLSLLPDIVQPDDVIIQGSLCVGLDCVVNESFGFDTIRLKENNTRISFNDTSTGAFPTNDWTIRANSSASGGASFLAFVDRGASENGDEVGTIVFEVDAGAPANAVKVDSSGRLGLRTGTPVLDVHADTTNTPAIRLEQNNGGGFTAQTWDIGGNEANFFVRDVTGGSRLPFRIRPGAPTSSVDISATGSVGIGTASPGTLIGGFTLSGTVLQVRDNTTNAQLLLSASGTGVPAIRMENSNATATRRVFDSRYDGTGNLVSWRFINEATGAVTQDKVLVLTNTGNVGIGTTVPDQRLSVSGDASKSAGGGSWQVFSDERLKNIKGNFNSGLKAVLQLQPIRYQYKQNNALGLQSVTESVGFGAQSLQKVIPEAVTRNGNGYLMVNNDPILWTMLNAIKEQQKEIAELKGQVQKLQAVARKHRK
jgi:hypothetical protein